jgi:hypothetical protein
VRAGTLAWCSRVEEGGSRTLAATLVGSGGTRLSAGQSAQLVAQGVVEANRALAERGARVTRLVLVELHAERASEAWRALRAASLARADEFALDAAVQWAPGAMPGPLQAGYRGADYDFVSATTQRSGREATIVYAVDTRRARTEIVSQAPQAALVRPLVRDALRHPGAHAGLGRALFALLVPRELEPVLVGASELVLELDAGTAGIPWELLEAGAATHDRPWAVRTRLVRKLRTRKASAPPKDAARDIGALVIGDPHTDSRCPALPAARAEAAAVAQRLARQMSGDSLKTLFASGGRPRPRAQAVVAALLARPWTIVHVAGHATDAATDGSAAGIVLSGGAVLGAREFASLRAVPELVFVNACHSAALARQPLELAPPSERAATLAGELIALGVRCVVAAGWAIEDETAQRFAARFYDSLLLGRRYVDAVGEARELAWKQGGTTWAAYQCYGDPDWTLRRGVRAQRDDPDVATEYVDVASGADLVVALDSIAVRSRAPFADIALERKRLAYLQRRFASLASTRGEVLAAFGRAYEALGNVDRAIDRYTQALAAASSNAALEPPPFEALAQRIVAATASGALQTQRPALLADIRALAARHPAPAAWQRLLGRMRSTLKGQAGAQPLLRALAAGADG